MSFLENRFLRKHASQTCFLHLVSGVIHLHTAEVIGQHDADGESEAVKHKIAKYMEVPGAPHKCGMWAPALCRTGQRTP